MSCKRLKAGKSDNNLTKSRVTVLEEIVLVVGAFIEGPVEVVAGVGHEGGGL